MPFGSGKIDFPTILHCGSQGREKRRPKHKWCGNNSTKINKTFCLTIKNIKKSAKTQQQH